VLTRSRSNPTVLPAAFVAMSVAVCLGASAGAPALSERRTLQDQEQAVASLIACLEAAAKEIAGQRMAVVEAEHSHPNAAETPGGTGPNFVEAPIIGLRPHLSRLNLPPPAARS
jgi:hypothetical protein